MLSLVPKPDASTREILEVLAGTVLIAVGVLLLRNREKLAAKPLPQVKSGGRASWVLGATITAVELPTAFPYFGALAAIVGSGLGLLNRVFLLVLFNVCFVMPMIGIIVVLEVAPDSADAVLGRVRDFLQRHWPVLLAVVAIIAGGITVALGATGTVRQAKECCGRPLKPRRDLASRAWSGLGAGCSTRRRSRCTHAHGRTGSAASHLPPEPRQGRRRSPRRSGAPDSEAPICGPRVRAGGG